MGLYSHTYICVWGTIWFLSCLYSRTFFVRKHSLTNNICVRGFLCVSNCAWAKTHKQIFVCEVRAWVSCVGLCVSKKLTYITNLVFGSKTFCCWIKNLVFGISWAPSGTLNTKLWPPFYLPFCLKYAQSCHCNSNYKKIKVSKQVKNQNFSPLIIYQWKAFEVIFTQNHEWGHLEVGQKSKNFKYNNFCSHFFIHILMV